MATEPNQRFSSFAYLNASQTLGAFNDNFFKLLVGYFLIKLEGAENSQRLLAAAGAVYVLPFLIFSRVGGQLADHFSKRNVIVFTRICQLVVGLLSIVAFYFESKIGAYCCLFALTTFSTVFTIARNSVLPELIPPEKISKANGLVASFSFLGIIVGAFSASFILEMTHRNFMIAGIFLTLIASLSLLTSLFIQYTPPTRSSQKIKLFFLAEIYDTLKLSTQYPALLPAIFGSAYFLFFGAFCQLNIIPFAMQSLHMTDVQGGYLFLLSAVGIGVGSLLAGKISGNTVELGLIPIVGIAMGICCYCMDIFADSFTAILAFTILIGLFGGMFDIPQESYIQYKSPPESRGKIIAASRFLSFFGVLCASGLLYVLSEVFHVNASTGFLILGSITLVVVAIFSVCYFEHLKSFIARCPSKRCS